MCTYADPWVLQSLLGSDSLGWVDSQHLVDQIFSLGSHRVPLWGRKLKRIHTHAFPHIYSTYEQHNIGFKVREVIVAAEAGSHRTPQL